MGGKSNQNKGIALKIELDVKKAQQTYENLRPLVRETPVLKWDGPLKERFFQDREVTFKLEFLQHSGSFKVRGAFSVMLGNLQQVKAKGVVAVSRGNHACAVSYAGMQLGASVKVILPKGVSARRVAKCENYGAEVIFTKDVNEAFALSEEIQDEEGRLLVHPYEGELTALGTAGIGKEFLQQAPELQAIYVACGGGGLLGGMAAYIKQVASHCKIFGVEPEMSDAISQSLAYGEAMPSSKIETIADSLATPLALPYSFGLCQKYVDDLLLVSEQEIAQSVNDLYEDLTLVLEPAGAAALSGALKHDSKVQKIGILLCGANIELAEYQKLRDFK